MHFPSVISSLDDGVCLPWYVGEDLFLGGTAEEQGFETTETGLGEAQGCECEIFPNPAGETQKSNKITITCMTCTFLILYAIKHKTTLSNV